MEPNSYSPMTPMLTDSLSPRNELTGLYAADRYVYPLTTNSNMFAAVEVGRFSLAMRLERCLVGGVGLSISIGIPTPLVSSCVCWSSAVCLLFVCCSSASRLLVVCISLTTLLLWLIVSTGENVWMMASTVSSKILQSIAETEGFNFHVSTVRAPWCLWKTLMIVV